MTDPPKRGRGRPRREGAEEHILGITRTMLREGGYTALTVDGVAARADVAKTTLYRRWPSKAALVAAALAPEADDAALTSLFKDADAEAVEAVAEILRPRHAELAAQLGEAEADRIVGALLTRIFVTRKV